MSEVSEKTLREEIEAAVTAIFSEKEEEEKRRRTEEALQTSAEAIQDLTESMEFKNEELESKDNEVSNLKEETKSLKAELEAAQQEVDTVKEELATANSAIEDMKKDRAAEQRMVELIELKVAGSDEASQLAKVREMSDEEFDDYKNERVTLRESVVAELKENLENGKEDNSDNHEESEDSSEEEENTSEEEDDSSENANEDEEDETTPPAEINRANAISAALNMEFTPSKDVMSKYAELGKAMAENLTKEK